MSGFKRQGSDPILELLLKNVAKYMDKDDGSSSGEPSITNNQPNRNEKFLKLKVTQQMKVSVAEEETIGSRSKGLENDKLYEEIDGHEDKTKAGENVKTINRTRINLNPSNKNQNKISVGRKENVRKSRAGYIRKVYTAEEDNILLEAVGKYGEQAVNFKEMEGRLGRHRSSISQRIRRLLGNGGGSYSLTTPRFTVLEDQFIVDLAIRQLPQICLSEIRLCNDNDRAEMQSKLKRPGKSCYHRWDRRLQPWILQYYAGTLNLDIKLKLVNYLEETFLDIKSIDWPLVAEMPKFAGHTSLSLKSLFFGNICNSFKQYDKSKEVSLQNVTEFVRNINKSHPKKMNRQLQVIEYFEKMVSEQKKTNFMLYRS